MFHCVKVILNSFNGFKHEFISTKMSDSTNKKKVFNDPVYGFITIPYDVILDLIDHPWFQRLRRIHQLGQTHLVYPGAQHTRFHHALGAMHLTLRAIETLRFKGHEITGDEEEAVLCAILLHDIGHGPFSHTLEHSIVKGVSHEQISLNFMHRLNEEFSGRLDLAIQIFSNQYHKRYLSQLISGQLDMDRLDYLKRDSFYTGVTEGDVGSSRIIKMLNIKDGELVIDEKAIYSIENFIVSRRFMYWQVYLHKTVVAADAMLTNILKRARKIYQDGKLYASPALDYFMRNQIHQSDFTTDRNTLKRFALLDDSDIISAIKAWSEHDDKVLSTLCRNLMNRKIFKIEISKEAYSAGQIEKMQHEVATRFNISFESAADFTAYGIIENNAYNPVKDRINLLFKDGTCTDIAMASDNLNIKALAQPVKKYYRCYPK
jgi:HD superfamily phosphohydrolase